MSTLLAGFKLPGWVSTVMQAAQTLAPVIPTLIGLIPMAPAAYDTHEIAQARAVLIAAAS